MSSPITSYLLEKKNSTFSYTLHGVIKYKYHVCTQRQRQNWPGADLLYKESWVPHLTYTVTLSENIPLTSMKHVNLQRNWSTYGTTLNIKISFNFLLVLFPMTVLLYILSRNIKARSCNSCYLGKAIGTTYSECVTLTLGIQHAERKHLIILSSAACPFLKYFHITSQTASILKKILNIKCV